jgi:enoyl-CoA hydratase
MKIEWIGQVAVLHMEAGKGNAISPDLLDALDARLDEVGDARALVVTGSGRFFSAGLALPLLMDLDRDGMRAFMQRFGLVVMRLLQLPMPTIAAVNGHAIAGGCVLALQCDYRVMSSAVGKIGLSEVTLGIGLPTIVIETLRFHLPPSAFFPIALRGQLYEAKEALAIGLVDQVVSSEAVLETATAMAKELAAPGPAGYAQIKAELLRPVLAATQEHSAEGLEAWLDSWFSDDARAIVRATVDRLGNK